MGMSKSSEDALEKKTQEKHKKMVRKSEILNIQSLKNNPITPILIKKYSVGNKIDFSLMLRELVEFMNTDSLEKKTKFIFSVYDTDEDGFISSVELYELL